MGDAFKGRRLLIAAAVAVAVMAGVGAVAQAGLLSRAETSETHSRAAAAAIADPQGNGDIVAVAETEATRDDNGNSASATLLRVGDTKIYEAPQGYTSPLSVLNDQPTEALVDAGCDGPAFPPAPLCVGLLQSQVANDSEGGYTGAAMVVAQVGSPSVGYFGVLSSGAFQGPCPSGDSAVGAVVLNLTNYADSVDLSLSQAQCQAPS